MKNKIYNYKLDLTRSEIEFVNEFLKDKIMTLEKLLFRTKLMSPENHENLVITIDVGKNILKKIKKLNLTEEGYNDCN